MSFKKILFLLCGVGFSFSASADLVYPIGEMSKVECRFQKFSTLGDDCKMQLPILKTSDYTTYKNDYNLYRRVYTILWGATYTYGWDVGNGGHQGVDIATAEGTPAKAITDGKVVYAGFLTGRGNTVKIEHTINGNKIYANYAHLSKIDVAVGDSVTANTKVGEVGNTGNSTGNHLHFQIDLAVGGKGPRYRSSCTEKNYDTIVNTSVCFQELNNKTIDPLLFLETNGAVIKTNNVVEKPKTEVISQQGLLSREEIIKREIQEFLKLYQINIKITNLGGNIELGNKGTFKITVTSKRTKKPFTGSFPGDMFFKYDKNKLDIFPTGILQIDNGSREFSITPKISGKLTLDVYIGESFIKKLTFGVFDTKKEISPKQAVYSIQSNNVVSEVKKAALYFKDNYGLNIVGVNFNGTFTLKSDNNNIKFCVKKVQKISDLNKIYNIDCKNEQFKNQVTFTAKDAIYGLVVLNYKMLNTGMSTLLITNSKNEIISEKKLNGTLPTDLKVTHPYYTSLKQILELGLTTGINKGYFLPDKELTREDAVNFIRNILQYKASQCQDSGCSNSYNSKMVKLSEEYSDKFTYLTRIDFIKMVSNYVPITEYNENVTVFRDLTDGENAQVKNIFKNQTWNDYFGSTRYFQPNKNITRAEGVFILSLLIK